MESGENLVAVFELYAMVAINQRKSGLIFHISAVAILSKHGHGVGKFHVGVVAHSLISGNVCHFGAFAHHVFSHGNVAHLVVERSNSLHSGSGADGDRIGIHRRCGSGVGAVGGVVHGSAGGSAFDGHIKWCIVGAGCRSEDGLCYHDFAGAIGGDFGFFEAPLACSVGVARHGKGYGGCITYPGECSGSGIKCNATLRCCHCHIFEIGTAAKHHLVHGGGGGNGHRVAVILLSARSLTTIEADFFTTGIVSRIIF